MPGGGRRAGRWSTSPSGGPTAPTPEWRWPGRRPSPGSPPPPTWPPPTATGCRPAGRWPTRSSRRWPAAWPRASSAPSGRSPSITAATPSSSSTPGTRPAASTTPSSWPRNWRAARAAAGRRPARLRRHRGAGPPGPGAPRRRRPARRRRVRQRRARRVRDRPAPGRRRADRRLRRRHQLRHLGRRPDAGERLQAGGRRRPAHGQALDRARPRCPAPSRSGAGRASAATSSALADEPVPAPGAEPLLEEIDLDAEPGDRPRRWPPPGSGSRPTGPPFPSSTEDLTNPTRYEVEVSSRVTSSGGQQLRPRMTARSGPVPI